MIRTILPVRKSWIWIAVIGIILLIVGGCILLLRVRSMPSVPGSVSSLRIAMESSIRTLGGGTAYATFIKDNQPNSFDTQHSNAHLFGESLYATLGIKGFSVCDAQFNYGCYHGFITKAAGEGGLGVVHMLDQECGTNSSQESTACQHGIGHGILEFLGHTKLVEALEACSRTDQPNPLAGCTTGVFMEYNVPFVLAEDGSVSVEKRLMIDANKPYDPCPDLPGKYQRACYDALPQWWNQIYGADFKKFGQLCAALPASSEQSDCMDGIGRIVGSTANYDVPKTLAYCAFMPSEQFKSDCIYNASWALYTNIGAHEASARLCALATKKGTRACPFSLNL